MSNTHTGGPAFPSSEWDAQYERTFNTCGMTLRDYFAAKAMLIYLQDPCVNEIKRDPDSIATWCYIMADSMLKAREA